MKRGKGGGEGEEAGGDEREEAEQVGGIMITRLSFLPPPLPAVIPPVWPIRPVSNSAPLTTSFLDSPSFPSSSSPSTGACCNTITPNLTIDSRLVTTGNRIPSIYGDINRTRGEDPIRRET